MRRRRQVLQAVGGRTELHSRSMLGPYRQREKHGPAGMGGLVGDIQVRLLNTLVLTSFNSYRVNNPTQNEAEISSQRSAN